MLAASEASAEAAIQLPTIGADGWDDGLPRAVADRGSAGMKIVPMPALLQGLVVWQRSMMVRRSRCLRILGRSSGLWVSFVR